MNLLKQTCSIEGHLMLRAQYQRWTSTETARATFFISCPLWRFLLLIFQRKTNVMRAVGPRSGRYRRRRK